MGAALALLALLALALAAVTDGGSGAVPRGHLCEAPVGDARRFLAALLAVTAGAAALAVSNQRTPEPGTAADAYYAQVRIVLYDTREAVQFSIRERMVGSEGDTALAATAVASISGRLRDVPPPPDLRAAHERLIRVADVASGELSETNDERHRGSDRRRAADHGTHRTHLP